jgi:hypothetical protein
LNFAKADNQFGMQPPFVQVVLSPKMPGTPSCPQSGSLTVRTSHVPCRSMNVSLTP